MSDREDYDDHDDGGLEDNISIRTDEEDSDFEKGEEEEENGGFVHLGGDGYRNKRGFVKAKKEDYITSPYLTKYERARILGTRALQLSKNAPPMVIPQPGETDPYKLAERELIERKIPFIVRRYLPDRTYEDWPLKDLTYQ
uniref:Uncharacterized protein n=1 Tax=Strombidium inclinatum TaxID=197538 RepID=A0A7S3IK78_9SPIT|mmetsp:Transcript_24369/g.37756  ORF Transcript_24369/g.37756 Transcript_24369/m.37756 type:complete len:141 (+) Transcript_24369:35-457(+)